jgi:hypothetical protein
VKVGSPSALKFPTKPASDVPLKDWVVGSIPHFAEATAGIAKNAALTAARASNIIFVVMFAFRLVFHQSDPEYGVVLMPGLEVLHGTRSSKYTAVCEGLSRWVDLGCPASSPDR